MYALSEWARSSPADDFWTFAAILVLASVGGFIGGFYFLLRKRAIENIPTSKIRSAAQGYLELTGHGQLLEGPQIIAPLTNTPCTWYSFSVQERRRSGKNSRWVTIEKGISDSLFLLIDDTGKCIIDPEGASVIPSVTDTWYGTTPRPRHGKKTGRSFLSRGRYRYIEQRMHIGDDLYAIGLYKTVGGADGHFNINDEVIRLLREWKQDSESLLQQYDHNRDGKIDLQEWEAVREAAMNQVLTDHRELQSMPPVNIMGKTQDSRRPFILSAVPQDKLIKRYGYYAAG
ncbi:MAG: GIDE domain-containing protein, partial [Gammaproteobacteria bacterium]